MVVGNVLLAIIIGTVFRSVPHDAESMLKRSILLFYIITINAFLFSAEVSNPQDIPSALTPAGCFTMGASAHHREASTFWFLPTRGRIIVINCLRCA